MSGDFRNICDINNIPKLEERFETALEAQEYAKKNPNVVITRSPNDNGYIIKKKSNYLDKNIKFIVDITVLEEITDITDTELKEIINYISIFLSNRFDKLYEVNHFISKHNKWDDFSSIRSKNDYDSVYKEIDGILPKFFSIASKLLLTDSTSTKKLDKAEKW
jgi:hypothetical protein